MILSFLVGIIDSTDAPPAKKTDLELLSKSEVKFPDVDPESSDMTDYASDDSVMTILLLWSSRIRRTSGMRLIS